MKVTIKPINVYELSIDGVTLGNFEKSGDLEGVTAFKSPDGVIVTCSDAPESNVFVEIFGGTVQQPLGAELTLDVLSLSDGFMRVLACGEAGVKFCAKC